MAIDVGFLIDQILDEAAISQDDHCSRTKFERIHSAIFLCPLGESEMSEEISVLEVYNLLEMGIFERHLMQIAQKRNGRGTWTL